MDHWTLCKIICCSQGLAISDRKSKSVLEGTFSARSLIVTKWVQTGCKEFVAEPPNLDISCSCHSHYCQQWPDIRKSVRALISSESSKVRSCGLVYFFFFCCCFQYVAHGRKQTIIWLKSFDYLNHWPALYFVPHKKSFYQVTSAEVGTFWSQFCPKNCELEERLSLYARTYNWYCINYMK